MFFYKKTFHNNKKNGWQMFKQRGQAHSAIYVVRIKKHFVTSQHFIFSVTF
jgi:hypothetical protein